MAGKDGDEMRGNATDAQLQARFAQAEEESKPKRKVGRPKKTEEAKGTEIQKRMWIEAMGAAILNYQARTAADVEKCVPVADAAVEAFVKRWLQ